MKVKMTEKLAGWLVQKELAKAGDDEAKQVEAATKALADGTLAVDAYAELVREESKSGLAKSLEDTLKALVAGQTALAEGLVKLASKPVEPKAEDKPQPAGDKKAEPEPKSEPAESEEDREARIAKLTIPDVSGALAKSPGTGLLGARKGQPEFKGAWTQYESTKKGAAFPSLTPKGYRHPLAGQRVTEGIFGMTPNARSLDEPSELDRAKAGALLKWQITCAAGGKVPAKLRMTEHDWQLVQHSLHEDKWGGVIGGDCESVPGSTAVHNRKLRPSEIKALVDDTVTGGLEAAPIVFDDAFILTPLLHSELFPLVNVVPITRGRRIEGTLFANVTIQRGGGDDDAIDLFDTTGFITAFDTKIHVYDGGIEIGLDLISDSPLPLADIVRAQYGERLLNVLDEDIAIGDGVQELEGIMVATGTTSVSFAAGHTVSNWEAMLFGVPKRYKRGFEKGRLAFASTETSYSRARGIAVGTTDARRVFGMDEESYMLFEHPYAVVDAMANTQLFFANMARYRLYRRLGLTIRSTGEGRDLVRRNMWLITARARFGGQLEDGLAAAVSTTAPA